MAKRKNSQLLLDRLPERLSHSYTFLVLVFSILGLLALDFATRKREESRPAALPPLKSSSLPAPQMTAWNFFHPLWNESDPWTLFIKGSGSTGSALPTFSDDLSEYLSDPDSRIDKEFKVTSGLRKRVQFWVEIYAKYNSRIRVVHDRTDPGIIYGYIDLRPLYRTYGKGPATESKAIDIERKILKQVKSQLAEAIGLSNAKALSANERQSIRDFLSRVGALSSKATLVLIENMRSQTGQRDEFLQALHRSSTLLPHIETVLRKHNLPVALGRIPFVESSFNARARSSVGAVGIWQFMPETARQMIHGEDESMWSDPIKQTTSAAKLLQIYRSLLPDWSLTVTSYNSGVGRLRSLVAKHKIKDIDGLLRADGKDGLGFAGENFYAEVLAANIVEAYKEEIFKRMLGKVDLALVFKGKTPFPKEICDL